MEGMTNQSIVTLAVRTPTVTDGSAGLRFSLTSGTANDELVRLENRLSFLCIIVPFFSSSGAQTPPSKEGGYKRVEEKRSGNPSTVLPSQQLGGTSRTSRAAAVPSWCGRATWSAAVARA